MSTQQEYPKRLASFRSEIEAELVVNVLQSHDILATTTGSFTAGFKAEAPGEVSVFVPTGKFEDARLLLDEFRGQETPIDWSQVDVGTPE